MYERTYDQQLVETSRMLIATSTNFEKAEGVSSEQSITHSETNVSTIAPMIP